MKKIKFLFVMMTMMMFAVSVNAQRTHYSQANRSHQRTQTNRPVFGNNVIGYDYNINNTYYNGNGNSNSNRTQPMPKFYGDDLMLLKCSTPTGAYVPSTTTTTSSGSNWKNCHACSGSGRCQHCDGLGNNNNRHSGYQCGVCRGTGKCAGCDGKGGYHY